VTRIPLEKRWNYYIHLNTAAQWRTSEHPHMRNTESICMAYSSNTRGNWQKNLSSFIWIMLHGKCFTYVERNCDKL